MVERQLDNHSPKEIEKKVIKNCPTFTTTAIMSVNINDLIQNKKYAEVGMIFSRALPEGQAVEFLENVISTLNDGLHHKRAKTTSSSASNSSSNGIDTKFILNDSIDEQVITLAIQIPENMNLMSYIIGSKGINVINMGKESGTKFQLEKVGTRELICPPLYAE